VVGYSFTVYERTLPPAPSRGWFGFIVILILRLLKLKAKLQVLLNPELNCLGIKAGWGGRAAPPARGARGNKWIGKQPVKSHLRTKPRAEESKC
jgi:hypothetical protein